MIGSPASRGAVASVGAAGRACLAVAAAVSAVTTPTAARVTMVGGAQCRFATVDCVVKNRFTMHAPVEIAVHACFDQDRRPAYTTHLDTARPTRCRLWQVGDMPAAAWHVCLPGDSVAKVED